MSFGDDFEKFLKEYNILSMAVAFIMGLAAKDVVNSLVNNIIMPLIDFIQPSGGWRNITLTMGPATLGVGQFFGSLVDFAIIAVVIFFMVKWSTKATEKTKGILGNHPKNKV